MESSLSVFSRVIFGEWLIHELGGIFLNEFGVIIALVVLFLVVVVPLYWLIGVYNSESVSGPFIAGLFAWLLGYIVFLVVLTPLQVVFLSRAGFSVASLNDPSLAQQAMRYLNQHVGYLITYAVVFAIVLEVTRFTLFWLFRSRLVSKDMVFVLGGGWVASNMVFVYVPAFLQLRNYGDVISAWYYVYTILDAVTTIVFQVALGFVIVRFFLWDDKFALPEAIAWSSVFAFAQSYLFYDLFPLMTSNSAIYTWGTLGASVFLATGLVFRVSMIVRPLLVNEFS